MSILNKLPYDTYGQTRSVIFSQCQFFLYVLLRKDESMYHAMGYSSMLVMQAGMTFDPKDVDAAMTSLRESLRTCQRYCTLLSLAIYCFRNYFQGEFRCPVEKPPSVLSVPDSFKMPFPFTFSSPAFVGRMDL